MSITFQTHYDGHHFRSRIEARWAVFFNTAGIHWEYEKQGYELPSGRYLPDFWLPDVDGGCWFEVKGAEPTKQERTLASELADATGHPVYIAAGQINRITDRDDGAQEIEKFFPSDEHGIGGWDNLHEFCACLTCGRIGIEFEGRSERICWHTRTRERLHNATAPIFAQAADSARRARFEHGETPR